MKGLIPGTIFCLFTNSVIAQGFADHSSLGTVDLALCTAAAMKSGQGIALYKRWSSALDARYKIIYPALSDAQRDAYTSERIIDKRKNLERRGVATAPAYLRFYASNCEPFQP